MLAGPDSPSPTPSPAFEDDVLELLEAGRLGVEYEPLVEAGSGRTVAHEALARFHRPDGSTVSPAPVFAWLHRAPSLLVETEVALKRLQLERAPGDTLFVNLDPDSYAGAPDGGAELLGLVSGAGVDVVVEAIENLRAGDAARSRAMVLALREAGVPFALDDVGAWNGLVSFDLLALADYVKLDGSLVRGRRDVRRLAVAHALVELASRTGARTVLEGVETSADLALARDLGVHLVQGHLFRERCVRVAP